MSRLFAAGLASLVFAGCGGETEEAEPAEDTLPATTAAAAEEPEPEAEAPPEPTVIEEPEPPPPEPLPGLPAELAGYQDWTKLNAAPIPPRDPDPHRGTKDVFVSTTPRGGVYPPGAIVVKEARRPGASFIGLVAMMRKEAGANPEHNDWVMVEWVRDAPNAEFREIASGAVCTSCHVQARDRDYVFTQG